MNPSQELPDPNQGKLLSDLVHLLEQNPEALRQLKKSLDAAAAAEPVVPSGEPSPTAQTMPHTGSLDLRSSPLVHQVPAKKAGASISKAVAGIQNVSPSDVAHGLPARQRFWKTIGGGSLSLAISIHILLLVVGAFWIIQIIQEPAKKVDFMPSSGAGGERGAQVNVQQKKLATITPSTRVKQVFAEGASSTFALPDPGDSFGEMSPLSSLGGGGMSGGMGGSGLGAGFGKGSGSGAGAAVGGAGAGKWFGPLNLFGQKGALDGIEGTFRDFKMDGNKQPTGADPSMGNYFQILQPFKRRGWESARWKHYESPTKLNAKFFFFPAIEDRLAGPAFDSKDSKAGLWIAHYRGRCKAWQPGNYRFVGWGDNVLAVKIGNKVVLDACDVQSQDGSGAFLDKRENVGGVSFPNKQVPTSVYAGEWVRFGTSDETIEVLLGDHGGIFCAGLFIQPEGMPLTFGPTGIPNIPLFMLGTLSEEEKQLLKDVPAKAFEGPIFLAKPRPSLNF